MKRTLAALLVGLFLVPSLVSAATTDAELIRQLRAEIAVLKERVRTLERGSSFSEKLSESSSLLASKKAEFVKGKATLKAECKKVKRVDSRKNSKYTYCKNLEEKQGALLKEIPALQKKVDVLKALED